MEIDYKNNNIFNELTDKVNESISGFNNETDDTLLNPSTNAGSKKYNIKLDENEQKAQADGFLNYSSGKQMVNPEEYSSSDIKAVLGTNEADGTINSTKALAANYELEDYEYITSGKLWRDTLGSTAYADLKYRCGLEKDASFTDYYSRTGYIPEGYEKEARLLLAEEKRMKYYVEYEKGNMSETDFLYNAYGKDLLKESGHDLSSTLYWYNKAKKNDFTNPLDSDTFLEQLISDSRSLWQKETWYQSAATRDVGSTLAGLATGAELSTESFQTVFKTEVEALKPYFDNDVKKIMTYYQAGYLGGAFSPMVDIDNDGKYDYYYHTDGKLYAVKGSSGTGNSTCEVVYNEDGSVHSVQINEFIDGWLDSLWEGFRDFFVGFGDLFMIVPGLINTDIMANYEAWKKRTISDEDRVVFDSMDKWNGDDWGNAVANGIGTIAGMVTLMIATAGIGNALQASGQAAKAGQELGKNLAVNVTKDTAKQSISQAISTIGDQAAKVGGKRAQKAFMDNALKQLTKNLTKDIATDAIVKEALKAGASKIGASAARATAANIGRNVARVLVGQGGFTNTLSQAKGGSLVNSTLTRIAQSTGKTGLQKVTANAWVRGLSTGAELAARDLFTVVTQLKAKNKALQYLEYATDGEVKALSEAEIWGRGGIIAGVDFIVSSLFRASGSQGFSSRVYRNSDTLLNKDTIIKAFSEQNKNIVENYLKSMKAWARADAVFDIFENIVTSGTQAAVSNPYAKLGSAESWTTMGQALANPAFIMSNIYATYNNLVSWGGKADGRPISTSIYDDRLESITKQLNITSRTLTADLKTFKDIIVADTSKDATRLASLLDTISEQVAQKLRGDSKEKPSAQIDNVLTAARDLDNLFTEDVTEANKKAVLEAFNITESDYAEIKKVVKDYNKTAPEGQKLGFVSGKIFYDANKENNENVAKAYKLVLDAVSEREAELKQKELDAGNAFFRGKALKNFFTGAKVSCKYMSTLLSDAISKISNAPFKLDYNVIRHSFISERFTTIKNLVEDNSSTEMNNKELQELNDYLNASFFKFHSLSSSTVTAGVQYEMEEIKDAKGNIIGYKPTANIQSDDNVILQLFAQPNNLRIIQMLVSKGLIDITKTDDGKLMFNTANMAPWYALEIDNTKHNEVLKYTVRDQGMKTFLNVMDAVSFMFEDERLNDLDIIDYDEPLILKVRVATGKTNGSGNDEFKDVYLMPSKICGNIDTGTSYGDIANRLMALQGILYATYGLYKQASEGRVDTLSATKYLAQLGSLLTEGKAMDPFFDFLKKFDSSDETERAEARANLPKAMAALLSGVKFLTDDGKDMESAFLNRRQIMALVKAGVLDDELLDTLIQNYGSAKNGTGSTNIAEAAQEIKLYRDTEDKVKTSLDILDHFSKKGSVNKKDAETLKECMSILKSNKKLYDSMENDGYIPGPIKKLLEEGNLETFLQGLQRRDSHLEDLAKTLYRLSESNNSEAKKEIETLLRTILDEDLYTQKIIEASPLNSAKNFVVRYLNQIKSYSYSFQIADSHTVKIFADTISSLTLGEFRDFLFNPVQFIDNFNKTNTDITSDMDISLIEGVFKKGSKGYVVDNNFLLSFMLSNYFADYADFNITIHTYSEVNNLIEQIYTRTLSNPLSSSFLYLSRLYKIATGDDLDINSLKVLSNTKKGVKRAYNTIVIKTPEGDKSLADVIFNSDRTKAIVSDSIIDDTIDNTVQLIQDNLNYYYTDTTIASKQNVIELDVLNFLPANLRKALVDFINSKALAGKMGAKAKIDSNNLVKEFSKLLTGSGTSSATATQFRAYKALIDECTITGNYILRFNINDPSSVNRLEKLLTLCGYDTFDLKNTEAGVSDIQGLTYKTIDTHNFNTDLESGKFYRIARRVMEKKGLANKVTPSKASKDMSFVLYNLFSGVSKFNDNTKIDLFSSDGKPLYYFSLIYNNLNNLPFEFTDVFGNTEQDRSEKGTLAGGAQLLQYIVKHRGLGLDLTNAAIDERSRNNLIVLKLVEKAHEYLTEFTGKQAQTVRVTVADKNKKDFEKMYSSNNSFFRISGNVDNTYFLEPNTNINDKDFISDYLTHINKSGFDLRELLPVIWQNNLSLKNTEFEAYEYISNETLFSELANLKLDGLLTIEDFMNFKTLEAKDFYSFDKKEYEAFCIKNKDKTVGELLKDIDDNTNNYYLKSLKYELTLSKQYSDYLEINLDTNSDLLAFANPYIYRILGSLLNSKYAYLLEKDYNITDADLNNLTKELKDNLNTAQSSYIPQATGTGNVNLKEGFTSLDAEKFNSRNDVDDISSETLNKLLIILKNTEDDLLIRLSNDNSLLLPNELLSCISLFCDDVNGSLSIPMEYFIQATDSQRKTFLNFLDELIANKTTYNLSDDEVSSINSLKNVLQTKENIIVTSLKQGDDVGIKPDQILFPSEIPNAPSQGVHPKAGFLGNGVGQLSTANLDKINELVMASNFNKTAKNPFVKLSTINVDDDATVYPFKSSFAKLLNNTVARYSDKPGSTLVYNMDLDESIANAVCSVLAFTESAKLLLKDLSQATGISDLDNIPLEVLFDLGIQANLLTTGADYQSEYASSIVLKYNSKTKEYEIVPLVTSSTDTEKDVFSYFLGVETRHDKVKNISLATIEEEINADKNVHYFLLKSNKNSFREAVDGFNDKTRLLYLNNEQTRIDLQDAIITKMINSREDWLTYTPSRDLLSKHLNEYYRLDKIKTIDIWDNVVDSLVNIGVDKDVAELVRPTVESLYVGNPTSLNDQWVNDSFGEFLEDFRNRVPSKQFKAFTDALCWGITYKALKTQDDSAILEASFTLEQTFNNHLIKDLGMSYENANEVLDRIDKIVSAIMENNPDYYDTIKQNIADLSSDAATKKDIQTYLIQKLLLNRKDAFDLFSIVNMSRGKSLLDIKNASKKQNTSDIATSWVNTKNNKDNNIDAYNFVTKTNHAIYDTEYLVSDEEGKEPSFDDVYQIGYIIRKAAKDTIVSEDTFNNVEKISVLVRDNILNVKEKYSYVESDTSFKHKQSLCKSGLSQIQEGNTTYYIVDNVQQAVDLFAVQLNSKKVSVILSYNGKNDDSTVVSDNNILKHYCSSSTNNTVKTFFDNVDELDIRNDLMRMSLSSETEDLNSDSMDTLRKRGFIKLNKNTEAHDALSDSMDEYEIALRIINNKLNSDNLYSKPIDDIIDLFDGYDSDGKLKPELEEVLDNVKLNKLNNTSESFNRISDSIDIDKSSIKRSDETVKRLLDAYNITFEGILRRVELKDLQNIRENYLEIFDQSFNSRYFASIKNKRSRNALRNMLLGIVNNQIDLEVAFSSVLKRTNDAGEEYFDINDIRDIDSLRRGFESLTSLLSTAYTLYKLDTTNKYSSTYISNKNKTKTFYSEDIKTIARYIAEAKLLGDVQYNEIIQTRKDKHLSLDTIKKEAKDLLSNSLASDKAESIYSKGFYNMLKDEKADILSIKDSRDSLTQQEMYSQFYKPIATVLGFIADDNGNITDTTLVDSMSPQLRKALMSDLLHVYGATKQAMENRQKVINTNKLYGFKYNIVKRKDTYLDGMLNELTSADGIFNKNLRNKTALWSMGHERCKKIGEGEYGTLYIGSKLLTSNKAFKDMYGLYKDGDEFYTLVWRQPLQQSTPLQIMKVKVTDGETFAMTTTTADNFFNGDFDGDQYFFSHPDDLTNSAETQELFKLQNLHTQLFYNLFNKKNRTLSDQLILQEKYKGLANEVFQNKDVKDAFYANFANIDYDAANRKVTNIPYYMGDRTNIDTFNNKFSEAFDAIVSTNKYKNLSDDDKKELKSRFLEMFGIKIYKTSKGSIVRSSNPFYRDDEILTAKLIELNKNYMQDNLLNTGMDAPENGQMAKNYKWKKSSVDMDEAYRLFFNSTFSLKEEDIDFFTNMLYSNKLSSTLIDRYVTSLEKYLSKEVIDWVRQYIKTDILDYTDALKANSKSTFDDYAIVAKRLSYLSNILQQEVLTSKVYNDALKNVMEKSFNKNNQIDYDKYQALYKFMNDEGYITDPKLSYSDKLSGIDIMMVDTAMLNTLFNDQQRRGYINTISNDSQEAQDIYLNLIFRGDENNANIQYRDGIEIMSRDKITSLHRRDKKVLGLGTAIVAVDISQNGLLNDSIKFYSKGKEALSYTKAHELNLNQLSKKERDTLVKLIYQKSFGKSLSQVKISGGELNACLNANFADRDYYLSGFVDGTNHSLLNSKQLTSNQTRHAKLILVDRVPLYTLAESNELKFGLRGSKALKGTVMLASPDEKPITVKEAKAKGETFKGSADMLISASLWDGANLSPGLDYEELYSSDPNKKIYRVKDLTLLNALNLEAQDTAKPRYIDTIGIIQGAHGTGSMFSYGNMFFRINKDTNTLTFDPEGYLNLKNKLHYHSLENTLQDVNAAKTIKLLKISYMLSVLDPEKRDRICLNITKGSSLPSLQETLDYLYKRGDIGGEYGDQVEDSIFESMSKEEHERLRKIIYSDKNNALGQVAFSEEIDRQRNNRYTTYFENELNTDMVKRHYRPKNNINIANARGYSDNADYLARLENSAHDINTSYISAESVLRMLLENTQGYFNKTALRNAYDNYDDQTKVGLKPVEGFLGTLYNGYKFIDGRQALSVTDKDAYTDELQSSKKAGNKLPYSEYIINQEKRRLVPMIGNGEERLKESYANTLDNAEIDSLLNNQIYRDAYRYNQLRFILPYFSNGSDAEIWDANNLYSKRFANSLHRKYAKYDEQQGRLVLGTTTVKPEKDLSGDLQPLTMQEEEARIIENSKSPKKVELAIKKARKIQDYRDNKKASLQLTRDYDSLDELSLSDKLTVIDYMNRWDNSDIKATLEKICKEYDMEKEVDDYTFKTSAQEPISYLRALRKDSNDVLHVAEFYSDDNGVKLVNSWLRSWGFKSSDNRDISLGNQTISATNSFNSYKDELLGNDYTLLIYNAKHNKTSYMMLNAYMNAEEIIEAYDELTYNKDKWIKTLGNATYQKYLDEVNNIISRDGDTIDSIRAKQQELLNNDYSLSILIKAASRINKRLMLESRAQDPFAFLGWFTDLDYNTPHKLMGYKNVQLKTFVKNDFIKGLNFDLEKMPEGKLASLLHTSSYGYVPMVEKIASQLAAAKTSDRLATYMKSAGYMQNVDVFDLAMNTFEKALQDYFTNVQIKGTKNTDVETHAQVTFQTLVAQCQMAGMDVYDIPVYKNESSLYDLFKFIYAQNIKNKESLQETAGMGSADYTQYIYKALLNATDSQKNIYESYYKTNELLLDATAVLASILEENPATKDILKSINESILNYAKSKNKVLVNRYGQKLRQGDLVNDYSSWHIFEDIMHVAKQANASKDYMSTQIAKDALEGNVYLMDASVADQLEKKVFTKRIHSVIHRAVNKAKAISTTLVMSSPTQLLDRMINFPMFDAGIVGSADAMTFRYMPTALSTVTKFLQAGETLKDTDIENDANLKMLMRFLSAQGNLDIKSSTVRGEKMSLPNIPGIRKYLKLTNELYSAGNLIPRFAYFLNLVASADPDTFKVNKLKTGVAYHMYDSIVGTDDDKATGIKSYLDASKSDLYKEFGDNAQKVADMDAQIVQIIAEHNGIEGNMPYAAKWLNENYNTMFLTFPMALVRWGKNRLQSLGYAFMDSDSDSTKYLLRQAGSMIVAQTILLAIQLLLSQNSQEYLKKKITGKGDEVTEEEEESAKNILFRGGCVKLFDSAIKGEETTTTGQNRGAGSALFNSYVADFIPYFNKDSNYDFGKVLKNQILSHTWSHTPFIIKDTVESIPKNTFLQSTSWYEPGDNFFDNYGRKILGYTLGYSQANAFADYMQSHRANNDLNENAFNRLKNAMSYAFCKKYSNMKNNKSEVRNYKKAFEIVYSYFKALYGNTNSKVISGSSGDSLKSKLQRAIETSNSSADVYFTIQNEVSKGASYSDVQKALNSISLRERLLNIGDYKKFMNCLSSSEQAVIKTALLYEEENYPYLEDILSEVNKQVNREKASESNTYSSRNISSILRTRGYNVPTYSNYNSNYNKYKKYYNFLNSYTNYNKSYNRNTTPLDTYNSMRNITDYSTSKDIWGTETQHYKDGTSYVKRDRGFNPFDLGGNK